MLDLNDAALVGMAALTVSVVGGPMTLSLLMLETTHDFALMGVVLTATLISSAFTRETFGYSFSTWRLHLRGSNIRSPRDIGWSVNLTAARLMRRDFVTVPEDETVGGFRQKIALGSASKAVIVDPQGCYRGIAVVASAYQPGLDLSAPITGQATLAGATLSPHTGIQTVLERFDEAAADELAVVDDRGQVLGVITEKHARRRYFEEVETAQRELFGEN